MKVTSQHTGREPSMIIRVVLCFFSVFLPFLLVVTLQTVTVMSCPFPPHHFKMAGGLCVPLHFQRNEKESLKALDCLLGIQQKAGVEYR